MVCRNVLGYYRQHEGKGLRSMPKYARKILQILVDPESRTFCLFVWFGLVGWIGSFVLF